MLAACRAMAITLDQLVASRILIQSKFVSTWNGIELHMSCLSEVLGRFLNSRLVSYAPIHAELSLLNIYTSRNLMIEVGCIFWLALSALSLKGGGCAFAVRLNASKRPFIIPTHLKLSPTKDFRLFPFFKCVLCRYCCQECPQHGRATGHPR